MISNKVLVNAFLDGGDFEYNWTPINFSIYSGLFHELVELAVDDWFEDTNIKSGYQYEIIFKHIIERDAGGAVTGEYFEPIYQEMYEV